MTITVDAARFGRALDFACLAAMRRSTVPVMAGVKAVANGRLALESSDFDLTVRAEIDYAGDPGSVLLPEPRRLRAAFKAGGGETISIVPGEAGKFAIESGALALGLSALAADDHPGAEPVGEELWGCDADAAVLRQLARVFPAISREETRYYLNGVCIDPPRAGEDGAERDWTWRFVATDGHRLMVADIPLPGADGEIPPRVIVPRQFLLAALSAFGKAAGPLRLSYGHAVRRNADKPDLVEKFGGLRFQIAGEVGGVALTLASKLIDGTYPDYTRAIPAAPKLALRTNRAGLMAAVRAVAAITDSKTRAVAFRAEPGRLRLTLKDADLGEASLVVPAAHDWPEGFTVGFNGDYLTALCAAFAGEEIVFALDDPGAPCVVRDPADTAFFAVQMPMRV